MELKPITVPAGWNAERDCAYFEEEGWSPMPSYQAALSNWLGFHYGNFIHAVALSVGCFLLRHPGLLPFELDCLSTAEQIALLECWVQRGLYVGKHRSELAECLRACAFYEAERARLLAEHQQAGEHAWLYPLVILCEELGGQAVELAELMGSGDPSYDELKRRQQEEL